MSMNNAQCGPRGFGLFYALLAALIVGASSVAILRTSMVRTLDTGGAHSAPLSDMAFDVCEPLLLAWLAESAPTVVLPPDAAQPQVHVLRHEIKMDSVHLEIRIAAWDQCGMTPPQLAERISSLDPEITDAARHLNDLSTLTPGLDAVGRKGLEQITRDVFPKPTDADEEAHENDLGALSDRPPAIGALLATHNGIATLDRSNAAEPIITLNTATMPLHLLDALLADTGLDIIDAVRSARASEQSPGLNVTTRVGDRDVRIHSGSVSWSFRIDVTLDRLTRSRWLVYQQIEGEWIRVQSLPIDE